MKYIYISAIVGIQLFFGFTQNAEAVNFQAGETSIIIDQETSGNIYRVIQNNVSIQNTVDGDVILISGGKVTIDGDIGGDATIIADSVEVKKLISGDLRFVAREVFIQSDILGEMLGVAEIIRVDSESTISGASNLVGSDISLQGSFLSDTVIRGMNIVSEGQYQKNTTLNGDRVKISGEYAEKLTIRSYSRLEYDQDASLQIFDLNYWAPERSSEIESQVLGTLNYDEGLVRNNEGRENSFYQKLENRLFNPITIIQVIWGAIILILISATAGSYLKSSAPSLLTSKQLPSTLGLGLVATLLVPIMSLISFISVIGLPIGALGFLIYGATILFSFSITSLVLVYRLNAIWKQTTTPMQEFFMAWGVNTIIIATIMIFPTLGGLIYFISMSLLWGIMIHKVSTPNLESKAL